MAKEFPDLKLEHQLVDSAAMIMISNPRKLNGVILTENMFGDMSVPLFRVQATCLETLLMLHIF